jgi:hypothetical protein
MVDLSFPWEVGDLFIMMSSSHVAHAYRRRL